MADELVSRDFAVPAGLRSEQFVLEPLGEQHHEADYAAWTSSIDHIRATPGFADRSWPHPMAPEQNRDDLRKHGADFAARRGFAYTVLDPSGGDVIGCVYLYPPRRDGYDVDVLSWVRASSADLDAPLYRVVHDWLATAWPFTAPDYAPR